MTFFLSIKHITCLKIVTVKRYHEISTIHDTQFDIISISSLDIPSRNYKFLQLNYNCILFCLNQESPRGETVEETEQSLEDLMAQMRKL